MKTYQVERLSNGLIRVFCLKSKLKGCYKSDGSYAFGDLRADNLDELISRLDGKDKGFTLIETLVVVIIVGVLAAIAGPSWIGFIQQQKLSTAADRVYWEVVGAQLRAKTEKLSKSPSTVIREIDPSVSVTYPAGSMLQFDFKGSVKTGNLPYRINLSIAGNSSLQRCVVVRTLLGATTKGKDRAECDALSSAS